MTLHYHSNNSIKRMVGLEELDMTVMEENGYNTI
jgi:hypothetical protein